MRNVGFAWHALYKGKRLVRELQFSDKVIGVQCRELLVRIDAAGFEELQGGFADSLDFVEFGHGLS